MTSPNPLPRTASRVVLRRLRVDDLADFQAYRSDEAVGLYQGWTPMPDTEAAAFLEKMADATFFQPGEWFQFGIADPKTDTLIGDIGICVSSSPSQAEIGFSLRAPSQGLGLGAEAVSEAIAFVFDQTAVQKVIAITDARNLACVRMLERLGLRRDSESKAMFLGEPCVEYTYTAQRPSDAPG